MKSAASFFVLSVGAVCLWAQTPQQAPTPPPPPPPMHQHMHEHMAAMHQHMQEMKDQTAKMRAILEKMKANLSKITDPAVQQQAQLDVDLWEAMVQHMEGMAKMMSEHGGMGMGMRHEMPPKPPTPEEKPPAPPK